MGDATVPPEEIVDGVGSLGIEHDGGASTSAYADLGASVNLNAVAIGLGLHEVTFELQAFPGLVYEPEGYDGTVAVVFGNGTLFVDSSASVGVHEVVDGITERLADIGAIPDPTPGREFSVTPTEVPVPSDYADAPDPDPDPEDGGGDAAACDECGHGLSGDENYCPECGAAVAPTCPSCDHDLDGGEQFCPECGTGLAGE